MELPISQTSLLNDSVIKRTADIIPIQRNIIERPSTLITQSNAVDLITSAPVVTQTQNLPTATAVQIPVADAGALPVLVTDPGPDIIETPAPGMGSQLMNWVQANPVPAVAIGIGVIWLISEMTKGKK